MPRNIVLVCSIILFVCGLCPADSPSRINLTVYNDNLALVRETRPINFTNGRQLVSIADIPSGIDPVTLHFKAVSAPEKVTILEQNYVYDLASSDAILQKYLNRKISLKGDKDAVYDGYLISYDASSLVLAEQPSGGQTTIVQRSALRDIKLVALPEGLVTTPTLVWFIDSQLSGKHDAEVSYLTSGISWKADYVSVVSDDEKKLDLTGWVTLNNASGAAYTDARLKLMAGDVNRVNNGGFRGAKRAAIALMAEDSGAGFEEKSFFEYHLYTLGRPVTIKDKQIKQLELLSAQGVTAEKTYLSEDGNDQYRNGQPAGKVRVMLEIANSQKNNLGIPLPKGVIRVYKKDTDGSLQFIGEDSLDHTPKDETVRVYLGDAFDVIAERKKLSSEASTKYTTETFEVSLRNRKKEKVDIVCREHLYGDWEIIEATFKHLKKDAYTAEFKVPVSPDTETVLTYKVKTKIFR